ncbi:hypothetical protein RYR28_002722 [Edwardsiella piscicida]|uniref:BRO-N domain-containing protein n=1 Tax=Edwardsiella piscicida TaxID=1263550 RepID=UPI00290DF37A|nr:hypothetical protein [Edwardsiella piscicida]
MSTLNVSTMSFAGQSLRVITGYDKVTGNPQHELLFVATDVVKMAGLDKEMVRKTHTRWGSVGCNCLQLKDILAKGDILAALDTLKAGAPRWRDMWFFTESLTYSMLLRGKAPQSEPFRKWVTEEVLPSIRKTGSYNVNESTTEEGTMFAAEFAAMREQMKATLREI